MRRLQRTRPGGRIRWVLLGLALSGSLAGCAVEEVALFDQDGDGVLAGVDCNDQDSSLGSRYPDQDGDGFGAVGSGPLDGCDQATWAQNNTDCDDTVASVYPQAAELCNRTDDDCDGVSDDGLAVLEHFPDVDGDGYGEDGAGTLDCLIPSGHVLEAGDCDDSDEEVSPDGEEQCNDVDDNCDGDTDEGLAESPFRPDDDGDGYGDDRENQEVSDCRAPDGYVSDATDCNDKDKDVYPGAREHCDGQDEDCDGQLDEDPVDGSLYYGDADQDGVGAGPRNVLACTEGEGASSQGDDCDDANASVYPGAFERCNGQDDDCDSEIDEGSLDQDGNGVPDCSEVAVVVSAGFMSDGSSSKACEGKTYLEKELYALGFLLEGLGLNPVVFKEDPETGVDGNALLRYPLVIYHDGGNSDPPALSTVDALMTLQAEQHSLLFMGDDLISQAVLFDTQNSDRRFFELLYISRWTSGGTASRGAVVLNGEHPVITGPAGVVQDFAYSEDMDLGQGANRGETSLMVVVNTNAPAVLAAEPLGQRTVVMLPSLYSSAYMCPVSDTEGLASLEILVQNAVSWLLFW